MRPDPDSVLARVSAEQGHDKRAKLKVFFGCAPGVGKTYRMLQVARELIDEHVDVLGGVVETHGRYDTDALLLGIPLLGKKRIEYRGKSLDEFDLDGALARKPKVLLLDELAHTNAPGSRHAKRWQDALELLESGIDVYTTLNVQHLESLHDVVAQITGVQVRESVPDSMLERADEVELVDLAPEELMARLAEGKIYLPDQAARASSGFFQRGNLLALRELALRRMAERVDVDVLAWRQQQGVASTWPASERIMVCVGPAPASAKLLRAGRRIAAGLRAPWVAVWVESLSAASMSEANRSRLEAHLKLAESLGAQVVRLTGSSVSEAILDYGRRTNVTRLVVGKPTHSRLRDRMRGSLLDDIVRGSGDIDVHVISGDEGDALLDRERTRSLERTSWRGWAAAVALPSSTTLLALGIKYVLPVPDLEMLYLLAVIMTAVGFGRWPAIVAAALSVAAYDFFFVPPFFTFAVADSRYVLTFAMMFGVGWFASELAGQIRRQERRAVQREAYTRSLYALSVELAQANTEAQAATLIVRHVAGACDGAVFVLGFSTQLSDFVRKTASLAALASWPVGAVLDAAEWAVAAWVAQHGRPAGVGTATLPGAKVLCLPLKTSAGVGGVVAVRPTLSDAMGLESRGLLEAMVGQGASTLERLRLAAEAEEATLRAKTEAMRSSLLSAVSHDLRTPLAAITGSATALRDTSVSLPLHEQHELVDSICEEAERLERLVGNLLDMTRVESGGLAPKREWVPVDEVVGSALHRLEERLSGRPIELSLDAGVPLLHVDPVLMEQVVINLLENASKYTPEGSAIELAARLDANRATVELEVSDRGPGLPEGVGDRVFEKFYRGPHPGVAGAGLGLAICRGIVEAHGGHIAALSRRGGGLTFRVTLPVAKEPPS